MNKLYMSVQDHRLAVKIQELFQTEIIRKHKNSLHCHQNRTLLSDS